MTTGGQNKMRPMTKAPSAITAILVILAAGCGKAETASAPAYASRHSTLRLGEFLVTGSIRIETHGLDSRIYDRQIKAHCRPPDPNDKLLRLRCVGFLKGRLRGVTMAPGRRIVLGSETWRIGVTQQGHLKTAHPEGYSTIDGGPISSYLKVDAKFNCYGHIWGDAGTPPDVACEDPPDEASRLKLALERQR